MNIKSYSDRLSQYARRAGFAVHRYGAIDEHELFAYTREAENEADAPHFYISAGVHGDEPAGCLAVLELLRLDRLPRDLRWSLVPMVNPTGLAARSRTNAGGIDVNRDYGPQPVSAEARFHLAWIGQQQFAAAYCLHEDYEAGGAYLYELKPAEAPTLSRPILDAMRPWVGIEMSPEIDEMPNLEGLMQPPAEAHARDREDLPEALCLGFHHTAWCFTFETPSGAPITDRIGAQIAAIETATHQWRVAVDV